MSSIVSRSLADANRAITARDSQVPMDLLHVRLSDSTWRTEHIGKPNKRP